ncbi:S8 family peptidase [Hyphomonas sp.]|uniref:S8 family peptidase n=1 Tax=Hyphomonas sp. TaxID=87 RepID=UPI001BCDB1C2|nr:S8 family peptidase [Hyphomonas sp.]
MARSDFDTRKTVSMAAALLLSASPLWLAACASGGGGSGGGSAPVQPLPPPPPPSSPPPPPPPAPPPASFETSEYNTTRGLGLINASTAYSRGATGSGIIVAVIDTGSDQTHPDLSGQFTGPTFDVNAADRSDPDIDAEGHGTLVTGIIAAKRDNQGILGTAFEARILDIRADRPGSCAEPDGCRYPVSDVAEAIRYAVDNGARVINLSLGSEPGSDQTIENAIAAAAARGVLIVVSAGNDAEPPTTDEDGNPVAAKGTTANSPSRAAGYANSLGRVVAVGAVIASDNPSTPEVEQVGRIAGFSNRAGPDAKNAYILAPGQGVVSTGPDDDVVFPGDPTNDADDIGDYYRISGTSFAAPYVSGSLALLLQTFPNLQARPEDALRILLDTADDYIDPSPDPVLGIAAGVGIDDVSGVGLLNLARAFQPQGAQSAYFDGQRVFLDQLPAAPGGAFGDWAEHGGLFQGVALIDRYDRAFELNAAAMSRAPTAPLADLRVRTASLAGETRAVRAGGIELSWHTPRLFEDPAAPYQAEPETQLSATFRFDGGAVSAGRGGSLPQIAPVASLVTEPGTPDALSPDGTWASITHAFGPVDVHAFTASDADRSRFGAGISRGGLGWRARTSLETIEDNQTALGGAVQSRLGAENEGQLTALTAEAAADIGGGWSLSGGAELGLVELEGLDTSAVQTSGWSLGASRLLGPATLSFVLAQPRRAERGVLTFETVTGADTAGFIFSERQIALTPSGRQLNFETRLRWQLQESWSAETAAAWITSPNHVATADDAGILWFGLRGQF